MQSLLGRLLRNRRFQAGRIPLLSLLNVGCGSKIEPGFINLDRDWHPGVHLCWEVRRRIPLADGSLDGIFTEHCLEHIPYDDCAAVLRDFFRLLRSGGTVRVIVPDGGLYLDLYHRACTGEAVEFPYIDEIGRRDLLKDMRYGFTPMMAVNRIFCSYGHLFTYDADTMGNLLRQAGFRDVARAAIRQGRSAPLLIDSEMRAPQSLVMEASR
jgi:predicted SAM-dependent methyltransferase